MTTPSQEEPAVEKKSFTEVFLGYRKILRKLVGGMVKPEDIDDIVQETFVRAYQSGLKQEIKHPRTYLYKAARNLALNHKQRKQFDTEGDSEKLEALGIELDDNLESRIISDEKFRLFCRALRELPPQCRRVFILKRIYGFNQKEIAAHLNISERTVEVHVAKGIARCAGYLKEKGYPMQSKRDGDLKPKRKTREKA